MKMKKPSLKGMQNTKHLGHFAQDKYICEGHNTSGVFPLDPSFNQGRQGRLVANIRPRFNGSEVKDYLGRVVGPSQGDIDRYNASQGQAEIAQQKMLDNINALRGFAPGKGSVNPKLEEMKQKLNARRVASARKKAGGKAPVDF